MKENYLKIINSLIFIAICGVVVTSVLFFLPITFEFFEFNKFVLVTSLTLTGLILMAIKMVLEKRASFTSTPLNIPIVVNLLVVFVASLSSIDQNISLFGLPFKIWPSFFAYTVVAALFFLTTTVLTKRKQVNLVLWILAISTTIASIIAILSYFGFFAPFDFARYRAFNTVGIINRLALIQVFVVPITLWWAVLEKNKIKALSALIVTLVLSFSLILISSLPTYIGLAAALIFLAISATKTKLEKQQQGTVALIAVFVCLFLVIRYVPQVAKGTLYAWTLQKEANVTEQQQIDTPKEKVPPLRVSWEIAASAVGKRPLFGTGVGTYQFVYTQLKPRVINTTTDWSTRFQRSNSDFTEIITTMGIFGILAYLMIVVATLRFIWALIFKSQHSQAYASIAAAIIGYLVLSLVTVSSFATIVVFFLGLALLSVLAKSSDEKQVFDLTVEVTTLKNKFAWFPLGTTSSDLIKTTPEGKGKSQVLPIIFLVLILLVSAYCLKTLYSTYRGDYFFRQSQLSLRSNDGDRTIQFLRRAIDTNPKADIYHRSLAETTLNAFITLARKGKDLTDSERELLSNLARVAIDQAQVASGYQILPLRLAGISAVNVQNWEVLASVYQALIGSLGGSDTHATNALTQAVSLDPENPVLHERLGILYLRLGQIDLAERKFLDSTIVKRDYGPGHYRLAKVLIEKKGDVSQIVNELVLAKRYLDPKDPATSDIDKELENYNAKLEEIRKEIGQKEATQSAQTASPTPEPEASPTPTPTASPEISPSPSPSL